MIPIILALRDSKHATLSAHERKEHCRVLWEIADLRLDARAQMFCEWVYHNDTGGNDLTGLLLLVIGTRKHACRIMGSLDS